MAALLLLCLVGFYFFTYRNVRFFIVPTASMEPTLYPDDMLITIKEPQYQRGDIIVAYDEEGYVAKRIIGLPGDRICVVDGALFINGKYASEPYIREPMIYNIEQPVRIPKDRFFYMGDNRNHSMDSSVAFSSFPETPLETDPMSYLGHINAIVGKVFFIYYPYTRLGAVYSYPLTNLDGQ